MTLIDLIVIMLYFVLVALAKFSVSSLSLAGLVIALIVERLIFGERFPPWTRVPPTP